MVIQYLKYIGKSFYCGHIKSYSYDPYINVHTNTRAVCAYLAYLYFEAQRNEHHLRTGQGFRLYRENRVYGAIGETQGSGDVPGKRGLLQRGHQHERLTGTHVRPFPGTLDGCE